VSFRARFDHLGSPAVDQHQARESVALEDLDAATHSGRGSCFDDSDGVGWSNTGGQRHQHMYMVCDTVDQQSLAAQVSYNTSHIRKQFASPGALEAM
jgi:hypothetical protein